MYDLVAIGNPVYDEIITPYTKTNGRILSGGSVNACLAAKRLGTRNVALIGCVGRDYETKIEKYLDTCGIQSKLIVSKNTGGFKLVYDGKGDRTLDIISIAGKIKPKDIPVEYLKARFILLAPILQEINLDFIKYLRKNSRAEIFLDPQGILREVGSKGRIREFNDLKITKRVLKLVDIVKPNEHESKNLTGLEDHFMSAKTLVNWGVKIGIVTLGDKGSILYENGRFFRIPAYKTVATDPTGAGDVYAGAFIHKYLENKDSYGAALFASAAASMKVECSGPEFQLDRDKVDARVQKIWSQA